MTSAAESSSRSHEDKSISSSSSSSLIEKIRQSNFHDHDIMIYPDLPTFRQVYSQATKEALERNEIVFLATTYDSFQKVIDSLTQVGVSVNKEAKDGNLIILDAIKAYQIDVFGAFKFAQSLVMRAAKDGKAGVFNISDLGSFFVADRIPTLLGYEQSIPKKMGLEFKGICAYHEGDFANLSKEQQEIILSAHNRNMAA
jgi:MEDS: MEthanogen/methylotroph, DcmR Sensory domain